MIEDRRNTKSLDGFQLSENTSARMLEDQLGIRFPQIPNRVELGLKNRLRLASERGIGGVVAGVLGHGNTLYHREYGAIFTPKGELFSELHENGHAFLDSINPSIRDRVDELPMMLERRMKGESVDLGDVEPALVSRCFDEGVAQYGALETAKNLPDEFDQDKILAMRKQVLNGEDGEKGDKFIKAQFDVVREVVADCKLILAESGPRVPFGILKQERRFATPQYHTGYYFVDGAVSELTRLGLQVGEALTGLIKNPPEIVDDLEKPHEFVQKL